MAARTQGPRRRTAYPVTGVGFAGCTVERAASRATAPDTLNRAATRNTATPAAARARADELSAHDTVSTPAFLAVARAVQPCTPPRTPATDTRPARFTRTVATIRDPPLTLADRIRIDGFFAFVDVAEIAGVAGPGVVVDVESVVGEGVGLGVGASLVAVSVALATWFASSLTM